MAKRGRPKKVAAEPLAAGEPPTGEGLNADELTAHVAETFGATKPKPQDLEDTDQKAGTKEEPPPAETKLEVAQQTDEPSTKEQPVEAEQTSAKPEEPEASAAPEEPSKEQETQEESAEPQMEEPAEDVKAGFLRDLRKLRERNAELEQQLQPPDRAPLPPGQGATALPPRQDATGVPSAPAIAWDSEGRPILPDAKDPAVRAYFRALQEPTPEEHHLEAQRQYAAQQLAQQREFEATKAAFIQEDPRREPIAERVQAATQFLDLRAREIMDRTGEKPIGAQRVAEFFERYGIADEFRRYVPEVDATEFPYFLDVMFSGSNLMLRRYMTDFCNRILGPKPDADEDPSVPSPKKRVVPDEIPPRLAAQGAVNPDRTGKPGKAERLEELTDELAQRPWTFTKAMHKELQELRKDLGIEIASL